MLGVPFTVRVSNTEEVVTSTNPAKETEELSYQKADAVAKELLEDAEQLYKGIFDRYLFRKN